MKKFRFLSTLLAALMVLSMITVMPVGAATAENAFFCDFEDTSVVVGETDYTKIKEAFGVYTRNTDGTSAGGIAEIKADADGKRGIGVTGDGFLYVPAPSNYSTGKAYIGFSVKGSSFGFVKAAFGKIIGGSNNDYKGHYMAKIESSVAPAIDASSTLANPVNCGDGWNDIFIVVDIDNSTWTVYMNGSKIGDTYSFLDKYGATALGDFYGIGFYDGDGSGDGMDEGMIDDISIVCSTDIATSTSADNTVISAVLPQQLAVEASDITVTKCGSTETVAVANVEGAANKLDITLSEALDAGYEYRVTFDNYDGIELYAYTEAKAAVDSDSVYSNDFEGPYNVTACGDGGKYTNIIVDQSIKNILESADKQTDQDGNEYNGVCWYEIEDNPTVLNGAQPSGYAIASRIAGYFYLLDNITETNTGIETYEFDYKLYGGSSTARNYDISFNVDISGEAKTLWSYAANAHEDKWRHMKIEYDNDAQTLTYLKKDGTPEVITGVNSFDGRITIGKFQSAAYTLFIDNYTHYVTVADPLAVEKVRYTDADDNVTGSDTISPATEKIDITFSKAVDSTIANAITLTANEETVNFGTPAINDNVVTLTIPANTLYGNAAIKLTIPAANRVYNVTTSAVDIDIADLTITGAKVSGSMAADAKITVTATGSASGPANIALIYAFYYDDALVAADVANEVINNSAAEISHTFTIEEAFNYDEVKAFVWDGLTTRVPLITAVKVQ